MGRKVLSIILSVMLLVSTMGIAAAAVPDTVEGKLTLMETDTYGQEQTGAVLERLQKLEKAYTGSYGSGSLMARADALYSKLYENNGAPSIMADLNAIEWNISHEVSMTPVDKRINDMEMKLAGKTSSGTYKSRIGALSTLSFGSETIPLYEVVVPANTLIKIALVDPVNAKNLKAGDTIRYKVAEDVLVDSSMIFAKGEPGTGTVEKVKQAKNFGRSAEVDIDFAKTKSIDGTEVDTILGEESKKQMTSLAMAAGASLAGIALLGPVGIIGGAFVKGSNIDLPEGTELYIQTENDETLYGVMTAGE